MRNLLLLDFITKLNNAKRWRYKYIEVESSNTNLILIKIFLDLGVIHGFRIIDEDFIEVVLKYRRSRCVFKKIKLVSIPSKPVYVTLVDLARMKDRSSSSFYVVSTNKGLFLDFECFFRRLSGKVILKIEL